MSDEVTAPLPPLVSLDRPAEATVEPELLELAGSPPTEARLLVLLVAMHVLLDLGLVIALCLAITR